MMEWDSRMQNTHSVQVLKAAIPFFDVSVGERIDMEGLLGAIRPFAAGRERRILDLFLQFFQMRHMMEMMQMMQAMQQAQEMAGESGGGDPFDMLKAMMPADQQETLDMVSAMMSMMQQESSSDSPEEQAGEDGDHNESVDF